MRLLLDTHVAVWAVSKPAAVPQRWRDELEASSNEVAVSVATLWEIAIKNGLEGKRASRFDVTLDQAEVAFREVEFDVLPIGIAALREVERLPRLHRDPFDRLFVATALADGWRLLTHDKQLAGYGPAVILF